MRAATWLLVTGGIVLVIVVGALIGGRDDSGETVPAGEWAQNLCGVVGVWRGTMEAIVEDVRTPSAVAPSGEEPQSETPQGRTGLVRVGVERAIQATEDMVDGVEDSGVPDTAGGQEAAEQISSWASGSLDDLEQAEDSLEEEAETIEEAVEQLTAAAGAIGSVVQSGVQAVVDIAATDPELGSAIQASSTCRQLREEGVEE